MDKITVLIINRNIYSWLKRMISRIEKFDNLYEIRDYLLEWNFFDDTWLGSKLKSAGTAIGDTFEKGWRGVKKLGVAISKGQWSQIWDLLKRGVK